MIREGQSSPTVDEPIAVDSRRQHGVSEVGEPAPTVEAETVLGLNRSDRRILAVLIGVALLLMVVHWYRLTQLRPAPIEVLHPEGYRFQLDVNRATWVEWMQLDRIGETLARRIVEDREQNGPFSSIDDVQRVKGIGPKTLDALRPHLTCEFPQPDDVTD